MFKDENTFWVAVWSLVATVVTVIVALCVYAGHIEDQKLVDLVSKGTDPIVAKCALEFPSQNAAPLVCVEAFKNASK